ncbi:MAG TPA: hypothetical protein VF729_07180, partial [Solirubrobacterales bacterium]
LFKLAPQSVAGAVKYQSQGSGSSRSVLATVASKEVSYTKSGVCVFLAPTGAGPHKSGDVSGGISMYGFS